MSDVSKKTAQDWLPVEHLEVSVMVDNHFHKHGVKTVGEARALLARADGLKSVGLAAKRHRKGIEDALRDFDARHAETIAPFKLIRRYGCYGCPFVSAASVESRYCGAKTVATHGGTWPLPPESCVDGAGNRSPEWCPLPVIVEKA